MKETTGNLWDYYNLEDYVVCITTNGDVTIRGFAVMGKGSALDAKVKVPGLEVDLGRHLTKNGNTPTYLDDYRILTFPTKKHWRDNSDPKLIRKSAMVLKVLADKNPGLNFVLPRPGCGCGNLKWEDVKKLLVDLPDNVTVISYKGE